MAAMKPEPEVVAFSMALDCVLEKMGEREREEKIRSLFGGVVSEEEIQLLLKRYNKEDLQQHGRRDRGAVNRF